MLKIEGKNFTKITLFLMQIDPYHMDLCLNTRWIFSTMNILLKKKDLFLIYIIESMEERKSRGKKFLGKRPGNKTGIKMS